MALKTVHKSVLIWYSPQEMFRLVTEVDHYPKFLPWCDQARVVGSEGASDLVEIGIRFGGINQKFVTRLRWLVRENVVGAGDGRPKQADDNDDGERLRTPRRQGGFGVDRWWQTTPRVRNGLHIMLRATQHRTSSRDPYGRPGHRRH